MPKANVNTASREQLMEAGVRAELADEILKLRRKGRIAAAEALAELPGVGPATLDELRKSLAFGEAGGSGDDRGRGRGAEQPARAGAEAAETGIGGLRVVQQVAGAVAEVEREVTHRSAEATVELGRALVDLLSEQTRHNLETWRALGEAVDWERVLRLQGEYLRVSLERAAQLTRRSLELGQTVMNAAADTVRDQAKKAA